MIANYHNHTWRCNHASGEERAYVEQAIAGGIRVMGFSDHTPYPFPEGTDIHTRMGMDQFEDYVNTVLTLKREYQGQIDIHLGLEVEYFPEYYPALQDFLKPYPVEYQILGQHYLDVGPVMPYIARPSPPEREGALLEQYVDLCIAGMETGDFLYLCHPDVFCFSGEQAVYETQMRRLCAAMERLHVPAEINLLGIYQHRHYPNPAFWEIAGAYDLNVILGTDAHKPEHVWVPDAEAKAMELVQRYHLHLLYQLPLPHRKEANP